MFDLSWFRTTLRTLDFSRVYKGFRTNWDFPNMIESIKSSKIDVFYVHSTKITSHKPLFYGKFYVVVKWSYEGEYFRPPLNHFQMDET